MEDGADPFLLLVGLFLYIVALDKLREDLIEGSDLSETRDAMENVSFLFDWGGDSAQAEWLEQSFLAEVPRVNGQAWEDGKQGGHWLVLPDPVIHKKKTQNSHNTVDT